LEDQQGSRKPRRSFHKKSMYVSYYFEMMFENRMTSYTRDKNLNAHAARTMATHSEGIFEYEQKP
jgi:hypothetical protein